MSKAIAYTGPATPFIHCADDSTGLEFEKELIYVGEFVAPNLRFSVDSALVEHWARTHAEQVTNGVDVNTPLEHTEDPEKNRGKVLSMSVRKNAKGLDALYGRIRFADKEAAKLANRVNVSIYSPPTFTDGKGRTYYRPIRHVALTANPVIPGLGPFETVAASMVEEKPMALSAAMKTLAEKLELKLSDTDTDDTISLAIDTAFKTLKDKKPEEKKPEEKPDAKPDAKKEEPLPIAASLLAIVQENRENKLDRLVDAGKISKAVRDKLAKQYCSPEAATLSLSANAVSDGFDGVVAALADNPAVVKLSSTSGAQTLAKRLDPATNGLLADAQRRAEAAKK